MRGDGGLKTASVLLSISASAMQHRLNQWSYPRDLLDHLAVRSAGDELSDLLPDAPVQAAANSRIPRAALSAPNERTTADHTHLVTATLIRLAKLVYTRVQPAIARPIPLWAGRVVWRILPHGPWLPLRNRPET